MILRPFNLEDFVRESNRIEGIARNPSGREIDELEAMLEARSLTVLRIKAFVSAYQPNAVIRDRSDLNVRVGNHIAPQGGPEIVDALTALLDRVNANRGVVSGPDGAYALHHEYETLHPFTDGNGRSGRAVWLWQLRGHAPLGFLHTWYYQTLQMGRASESHSGRNV